MVYTLVIVESPAKCKKIESYLGEGYKVIASYGHLRNIKDLKQIDIENNFAPKYSIIEDKIKLKQVENIRKEITNAANVIIATDDDREGEAIGWHICDLFGLSINTTKRIIFHEISESAIRNAILNPINLNMNLVYSQQSRAVLDMLVGYIISPILWKNISSKHEKGLSAGRCQTPALRIIYDNYLHNKEKSGLLVYNVNGYFTNLHLSYEMNKQLKTEDEIQKFLKVIENENTYFMNNNSVPKKNFKKPPEPLTTSKMQQMASNELHLSPKDTMKYAQELYENGYITYMRTDNPKYSNDFITNAKIYINNHYGEKYVNNNLDEPEEDKKDKNKKYKSKKDKSNNNIIVGAHEAIRPVSLDMKLTKVNNPKVIKLYELIRRNTLESCMTSAQFSSITSKIEVKNDKEKYEEYNFSYKTEQIIFPGWLEVENKYEKESPRYNYISNLKKDVIMKPSKINICFSLVELNSHYSESRLIQILEEKGIGRPSTFAMLVDKIQERGYVEKRNIEGKEIQNYDYVIEYENKKVVVNKVELTKTFGSEKNKLVITALGIIVIEYLVNHFDSFFNYDYTKYMENELDIIAKGNKLWYDLCNECYIKLNNITRELSCDKYLLKIDKNHSIIIGKYGPVIKYENGDFVSFIKIKKDLDIKQLENMENIVLEDIICNSSSSSSSSKPLGKYKGYDLYVKVGKYGLYASYNNENVSLKELDSKPVHLVSYEEVLHILEKDKMLDASKPVGLVRELTNELSIRSGKYGDYIFYKKPRAKKPLFFKLNGFNEDYKKCNKELLVNWITQTYLK
jgi:DNA topoisomerase I